MESFRETSQAFWNYVNILQRKIHWVRSNISLHFNLHGIGSSSPLHIFLRFCCLIQEKESSPIRASYSWRNFYIFAHFRLHLNLTIYLTVLHRQVCSLVSSSLCFLHIFNTSLSVWFQLHWVLLLPSSPLSQTLKKNNVWFTKLINVYDLLGNFTATWFYVSFSYCSILRSFLFSLCYTWSRSDFSLWNQ